MHKAKPFILVEIYLTGLKAEYKRHNLLGALQYSYQFTSSYKGSDTSQP